ncbi:exopolygalacturonase-like [Andrographis paniculata]|uniref:exopolygalacturonase-like n=1 Tax=Andrographis paniculata TaxID=175694 RepID=UPI0021E7436F|nr:exopolygalacturonase-like [Andrographis paniculata]
MGSHVISQAWFALGITCLLAVSPAAAGGRRQILTEETVFDVAAFGAKPDGVTDNSMEFIRAWKAACTCPGKAKVLIPAGNFASGEVVFAGPCTSPAPIIFEIKGNLTAAPDLSMYSNFAWIMFQHVDNLVITGGGTLDGNGKKVWQFADGTTPLPASLILETMGNSKLENLKFVDSMGFHIKTTSCHDIVITNLTITAPDDSPNTDGFHVSRSTNVKVTDCLIGTGDDCVSIGEGNTNVTVARVACGPGHGISIGSLGKRPDEKNLRGVTISNCSLTGTTNGARIKTCHDSPNLIASAIVFEDIVMTDVKNPIIIDQNYHSTPNSKESTVKLVDVHFRKIRGSTISEVGVWLNCSMANPCEGVELADIDLVPSGFLGPVGFACTNAMATMAGIFNPLGPRQCIA